MATPDISRLATDPRKHYSGVVMQQGRVLVDDDWNERERIDAEARRRDRVHVIGPVGTPDGGFRIANPAVTAGHVTFDIGPGSYFAGGLRATLDAPQTFDAQTEWLDQQPVAAPAGDRYDLAWLEVWETDVSAVEDAELFEPALGGPDTSTRRRTMFRVNLAEGVGLPDCAGAWTVLRHRWAEAHVGTVSAESELVANATLTIGFAVGDPADPCAPAVPGGYVGAANQAIRLELVDSGHFTWGFDNAAPLYRVEAVDQDTLRMLTLPKDQAHWPLRDQVVEILPWAAVLPNGEKLANATGRLARVGSSFDPDLGQFTIQPPLPAGYGLDWQARPDAAGLGAPFYFLRVWDRGDDLTSPPAIPFTQWVPQPLGTTGLTVDLRGPDLNPGDHWIIAARPDTPNQVVPWDFENHAGRRPQGIRRYVAPLALVHWSVAGGAVTGSVVSDCRETFRPLTRLQGCCTFTVGDGRRSHGDFSSVQAAVDSLPPGGGQVCVLPGEYHELVTIENRVDVTISGCGRPSRLVAPGGDREHAAIRIEDCQRVAVRALAIDAMVATGVRIVDSGDVTVADCELTIRDLGAVYATGSAGVTMVWNTVEIDALTAGVAAGSDAGLWAAVFVAADDVLIERNVIRLRAQASLSRAGLGGIQIGGGSSRCTIRRNRVDGGLGNGITLGSVRFLPAHLWPSLAANYETVFAQAVVSAPGAGFGIDDQGCLTSPTGYTPTDPEGQPLVPVSEGDVTDVRVIDNLLTGMGANGIGVARFFLPGQPGTITVERLTIDDNRVHGCLRLSIPTLPAPAREVVGFGGIALADCIDLVVRDNLITENGSGHVDPVCGVFVLRVTGAFLSGNRISGNGPIVSDEPDRPGNRGGVVLAQALAPVAASMGQLGAMSGVPGSYAAWLHGNVVAAPVGRALVIRAVGTVVVRDNAFQTLRASATGAPAPQPGAWAILPNPAVVSIVNLGVARELYTHASSLGGVQLGTFLHPPAGPTMGMHLLVGGDVVFKGNHVRLEAADQAANATCAILLFTRDDVSVQGNQSECGARVPLIGWNTIAAGWSIRMQGNRLTEPMPACQRSAIAFGVMNTTSDNQSTHCLTVIGHPSMRVDQANVALVALADGCSDSNQANALLSASLFTRP